MVETLVLITRVSTTQAGVLHELGFNIYHCAPFASDLIGWHTLKSSDQSSFPVRRASRAHTGVDEWQAVIPFLLIDVPGMTRCFSLEGASRSSPGAVRFFNPHTVSGCTGPAG